MIVYADDDDGITRTWITFYPNMPYGAMPCKRLNIAMKTARTMEIINITSDALIHKFMETDNIHENMMRKYLKYWEKIIEKLNSMSYAWSKWNKMCSLLY